MGNKLIFPLKQYFLRLTNLKPSDYVIAAIAWCGFLYVLHQWGWNWFAMLCISIFVAGCFIAIPSFARKKQPRRLPPARTIPKVIAVSEEVRTFIASYSSDDKERICFKWNGKHAQDFVDTNRVFREAVFSAIVYADVSAPLELVRDLFEEETSFSKEAWGADLRLMHLGQRMILEGQERMVLDFFRGKGKSFDTHCACGGFEVPAELAHRLSKYLTDFAEKSDVDRNLCLYGAKYILTLVPQN